MRDPILLHQCADWHLNEAKMTPKKYPKRIARHQGIALALQNEANGEGTTADVIKATLVRTGNG